MALTQDVMTRIGTMDLSKDELHWVLTELAQHCPAYVKIALNRVESYR